MLDTIVEQEDECRHSAMLAMEAYTTASNTHQSLMEVDGITMISDFLRSPSEGIVMLSMKVLSNFSQNCKYREGVCLTSSPDVERFHCVPMCLLNVLMGFVVSVLVICEAHLSPLHLLILCSRLWIDVGIKRRSWMYHECSAGDKGSGGPSRRPEHFVEAHRNRFE